MFKNIATLSIASIFLFGCSSKETYTVDFLKNNESKRQEVLAACQENKQSDENCKNANDAENQLKSEEYRNKITERKF